MFAHWQVRPHDAARIEALSRGAGVPPLIAHLLLNRGIAEPDQVRRFLEAKRMSMHDPELLHGAVEAAERISAAIREGRKIVVYGDYDVDGVCGASLLWACLKLAGAKAVECYIPHRIDEGYGVNGDAIRKLIQERGAELIVTVDCGVSANDEAKLARELGATFIITDHHTPGPVWPEADVVVHPRHPDGAYPFPDLCGCGVAFKLAWQICKSFGDGKKASPHLRDFLLSAINLVALATVADVVPLEDENRIFVRHGLRSLLADPSVGLKALMEVSGCLGKARLSTGHLGFHMAPRINAAGRLEGAMQAFELLTTDDPDRARELAAALDLCNKKRQEIERATVEEARALLDGAGGLGDRGAIVLGREGWHPGVVGIVAGRLAEWYHRPTIIVALRGGVGQGSARSVPGFNLVEALQACSEGLIGYGGHAAAAGLRVHADHFVAFAERFDQHCRANLSSEQRRKTLLIDTEVFLGQLTLPVVSAIENLEPYGVGNPRPVFLAENIHIVGDPKTFGDRQQHIRLRVGQGSCTLSAIGWNLATRARDLVRGVACSVVFTPEINEWKDRREVQLDLRDFRVRKEEETQVQTVRPVRGATPVVAPAVDS